MENNKYWVQTIYAVISPDGSAEDYLYSKDEAVKLARKLNGILVDKVLAKQKEME